MSGARVLVTGGSGFLGAHTILALLDAGYEVRTSVRSLERAPEVRRMLEHGGAPAKADVQFVAADLNADEGWAEAVKGCKHVLHVASPFPAQAPENEDDVIIPARDGALRVLAAADDAGVERVVLTSSFAAVGYGHPTSGRVFTEDDWTDTSADIGAYIKSKAVAERAAWEFVTQQAPGLDLVTINPVGIFGPVLGRDYASSIGIIQRLLDGKMPGVPKLYFAVADVRDVAALHLLAMTDPAAAGQRFIATSGEPLSMHDVAMVMREGLGDSGRQVPRRVLPSWLVRLSARRDPALREIVPQLGVIRKASSAKAERLLGWSPRPAQETILDTARSLLALDASSPHA